MKKKAWWDQLDSARSGRMAFRWLCAVCAVLLIADLFYDKHAHYGFEDWFGFYGIYGFVGCVLLVLSAKALRRLVKRDEDYYDRHDP
jgi:Na+/melibiose symporter-like transporter